MPFINEPEPADFKNNASAHKHPDFVTSEIKELLSSGRRREVSRDEVHVIILLQWLTIAISSGLFWIIDILISICRFPSLSARILEPLGIYFKKMIIFSNVTLSRVIIISIFLNTTKNIWVLLGKLTSS